MARSSRAVLVVPANNTTMEPEVRMLCPDIGTVDVARVPRPPRALTQDDIPAYMASTLQAAEPFTTSPADVVIYGCTAAGFLAGPEGNGRIVRELGRQSSAVVVSTADAMIAVLAAAGAKRIGVVTPYLPAVNEGLTAYLAASGIEVVTLSTFACGTTDALGRITEGEVMARALDVGETSADALFIACSQLPTVGILSALRERLKRPVWSSIAATAWAASRVLAGTTTQRSELAA